MTSLRDIFVLQGGGVVSIVGAGGKTTLLFALARELAAAGERVLTTTTTKILMPTREQSPQVIISADIGEIFERARQLPGRERHATAGRAYLVAQNKLKGFNVGEIARLDAGGHFPWIVVEADGAGHRSLKAPAAHEPVIPPCSRWVIAVVGLDALGQPLTEEWVFRSRLYADITGLPPGARITEQSVAAALSHEEGIMKGSPSGALKLILLNKADTKGMREAGRGIVRFLREKRDMVDRVVIGSLQGAGKPFEWYDLSPMPDIKKLGSLERRRQ